MGSIGPSRAAYGLSSQTGDDWRERSLCADRRVVPDVEIFFPIGTTGPAERQTSEATAICGICPVTGDCLTWALETGQDAGIWGGKTEDERRYMGNRRRKRKDPSELKPYCINGHEYTPENTGFNAGDGSRICKRCVADRLAKRSAGVPS